MSGKRPCRICGRWFRPNPRAGDRQRACGAVACQRERHRRACKRWRDRERGAERAHRLRQRLRSSGASSELAEAGVSWDVVRDAVGLQAAVILEELHQLLRDAVRDAVKLQVLEVTGKTDQVLVRRRRDGIAGSARAP